MYKTVIITGSASGIGKGIAKHFFQEGYKLLLIDINEEQLKRSKEEITEGFSYENMVTYLAGDLTQKAFREDIISFAEKKLGHLDVLINCAGIFPATPAFDISEDEWDNVFDLNVKALFFLSIDFAKSAKNRELQANIVNITSAASEVARPGVSHYCSSKAAVKMMTQVLALELADFGIRVNAVGPGLVETETLLKTLNNEKAKMEHKEKISYSPLNRTAKTSEIAEVVSFVSSHKASYMTGQNILVDGGYSAGRVFKSFN
ncbi:SDR family NAD(P)-dependent oxidoreductase [Oceanobacillus locisalsi]|uniref:SDR family NAD(P)-dependent oxidoreductase n=1 Tax=Oceanobacillus locisalsi TaxID=546107 RepID=A0ABW3NJX4_9BACI